MFGMSQIIAQRSTQAIILAVILLHRNAEVSAATSSCIDSHSTIDNTYPTTEAAAVGLNRILTITAKSYINELYVDDIKVRNLINEARWFLSDDVVLKLDARLISVVVADTSYTCGGILASVTDDFLVTDVSWKCSAQTYPQWFVLGFDDSSWSDAYVIGKNGDVTTPSECNILTEIPSISSNASWIWTASIVNAPEYDPIVFCRGYLPVCDLDSPCLNGGTCNRNDQKLCSCPSGISGTYCEISYLLANPLNEAALIGDTVIMNCKRTTTNVTWWFTTSGSTISSVIVSDCKVIPEYSSLYSVNITDYACNLVMHNVQLSHAGTYACQEMSTNDLRKSAQLTVINGVQQCWSSQSSVVYGQTVTITCQLHYSGNWPPAIRWTDLCGQTVTNATTDSTNNSVTSYIVIPAYFPSVPSFTSTSFFNESFLPDVTDDVSANNTPTNSYSVATPVLDVVCPSEFFKTSQNRCYWLLYEPSEWNVAQTKCQELYPGAYLIVISDESEQTDIADYFNTTGAFGEWWTSGYASDGCWNFAWHPLPGNFLPMNYTNWASDQPDCTDDWEPCVDIFSPLFQWRDWSCNSIRNPLCEFDLEPN